MRELEVTSLAQIKTFDPISLVNTLVYIVDDKGNRISNIGYKIMLIEIVPKPDNYYDNLCFMSESDDDSHTENIDESLVIRI